MGMLVDGQWRDVWYDTGASGGRFERKDSQFRNWVTADGAPGSTGRGGFKAEAGRYHLYVSLACPWAHRTLIYRALHGLEAAIGISIVDHEMLENGWTFRIRDGSTGDALFGSDFLHQIYTRADPLYSGRVTVPVLWDKQTHTIVSNESSEIIRMLNGPFAAISGPADDLYPAALRERIDAVNARVYRDINNGVYRCGFATTQSAYDEAFADLFSALDEMEGLLSRHRYLTGARLTEADWRLFPTLVRFDPVYVGHFKCNRNRIADMPNLTGFLRDLHAMPGVAATVSMHHIKAHYYGSHRTINPAGIIPEGPLLDFDAPHDRGRFATSAG